jgi:hypothetical protein
MFVRADVGDGPLNEKDGSAVPPTTAGLSATPGCSVSEDDQAALPFSIASSGCSVDL